MDKLPCAGMKRLLISGDHWAVMQPAAWHWINNIKHTYVGRGFGAQVKIFRPWMLSEESKFWNKKKNKLWQSRLGKSGKRSTPATVLKLRETGRVSYTGLLGLVVGHYCFFFVLPSAQWRAWRVGNVAPVCRGNALVRVCLKLESDMKQVWT